MDNVFQITLAGLIGASIVGLEMSTAATYLNTSFLLLRLRVFYIYIFIYGMLAACVMLLLPVLIESGLFGISASDETQGTANPAPIDLSNRWLQAVLVGISLKAFLHIRLFNISVGRTAFPIGMESLVQLFEPRLLRAIEMDHYEELQRFLEPYVGAHGNLEDVKRRALENIPRFLDQVEAAALRGDIHVARRVADVFDIYLRYSGRKQLGRVFAVNGAA